MYQNPAIKVLTAIRASQAIMTFPANTLRFAISAQKSTAVVKFSWTANVVSGASGTIFYIPPKTIFDQSNLRMPEKQIYVSVTGVATSPVSILYWK